MPDCAFFTNSLSHDQIVRWEMQITAEEQK